MTKSKIFRPAASLIALLLSVNVFSATEIANRDELRKRLGPLTPSQSLSDIKIAVLDNSFGGFVPDKGMLPASAELIEGPLRYPSQGSHGLGMAQIIWAMTGQSMNAPKIYLINTNGFTNFKAAVDFVIQNNIDIVLYSQVWLFGSNFDGSGFINEIVNRALDQGVIWINAAGNLSGHVYSGKVTGNTKELKLSNRLDENNFTITLAWNDFSDDETICTKKDLDLILVDRNGSVVRSSEYVQQGQGPDTRNPNDKRSCYAREAIDVAGLDRGEYKILVRAKSSNLSLDDRFKVIISDDRPGSIDFTDRTVGEEIMPPGDNPRVITIGDRSGMASVGPTADGRVKPDFVIEDSKVAFTNGNLTQGSSNAAAMVAGSIAVMKSLKPGITSEKILRLAKSLRVESGEIPGTIPVLQSPPWLGSLIPVGGFARSHAVTGRIIVFTPNDPLKEPYVARYTLRKTKPDDILACQTVTGACGVYPQSQDPFLSPPYIEFRQLRSGNSPGVWKAIDTLLPKL